MKLSAPVFQIARMNRMAANQTFSSEDPSGLSKTWEACIECISQPWVWVVIYVLVFCQAYVIVKRLSDRSMRNARRIMLETDGVEKC